VAGLPTSPLVSPPVVPRVNSYPPYTETLGDLAIDLARTAGLELDPWQQDSINVMCSVDADGKWLCFEHAEIVSRQNGKGAILEARVLAGFLLFGEELIIWTAHQYKTAMELFLRVQRLLRNLEKAGEIPAGLVKTTYTNGEQGFERTDTGARIKFIARSKDSGRGFSGDLVIIDEAYAYTLLMQEALMPTMSARPNPQICYASSPPLSGDTGEVLYALRERGEASLRARLHAAGDHSRCNKLVECMLLDLSRDVDDSLVWRDWGFAGELEQLDDIDLDDEALWPLANPGWGLRLTLAFTRKERRGMSREGFARERLGIWPRKVTGGAGAIDADLWRRLAAPGSERPEDVAFALHVNLMRTHAAIAYAGRRADGLIQVGIVDYRPGVSWVLNRIVTLKERWNPIAVGVDTRSENLLLDLGKAGITGPEDNDEPVRGDLALPGPADVAAAFGLVVDMCRREELRHLDEQPLNVAVEGAGTRPLAGGLAWDHKSSVEVSPLVAATLALWAYETRAHLVVGEYDPLNNIF
jgi:hypothetical protein